MTRPSALIAAAAICLSSCGDVAKLGESQGIGPDPVIPAANPPLIPTVNIALAKGWAAGGKPIARDSLEVTRFAGDLDHPRWLYVLPNGDVLVAETNAPAEHNCGSGIKGWIEKLVMKLAGAGVPSADRISLLRATREDGVADVHTHFLTDLKSPFGMALVGRYLYVANTDAIVRFPYAEGQTKISAPGEKIADLPAGCINRHWTKNVVASKDGRKLYVTVGSNSDHGERGPQNENQRAAIWELDLATGRHRVFASGLRNPNGLDREPATGALWITVNERDQLGSDLVPDYMTAVQDGGFYGWPCTYFRGKVDTRVGREWKCFDIESISPDYALGTHTASLGLAFSKESLLPDHFGAGAFVAQHGSWNRRPRSGYKVIFVPFKAGKPSGPVIDVLTGFLDEDGAALGRPVGVAIDKLGAVLVSDDVGNVIWRVGPTGGGAKTAGQDTAGSRSP